MSAEAVAHVDRRARAARMSAQRRLVAAGIDLDRVSSSAGRIRATARLKLNFHPDRRDRHGRTVAEGLLDDGRYGPQSETGISNGGRSAGDCNIGPTDIGTIDEFTSILAGGGRGLSGSAERFA